MSERLASNRRASLLSFLDPDPRRAEECYRRLRDKLVKFFEWKGCHHAEDLADETVLRAVRRLSEGVTIRRADQPYLFFHGVAMNVLAEWRRHKERSEEPLEMVVERPDSSGVRSKDMEDCVRLSLQQLTADEVELLEAYYLDRDRAELAAKFGTANALRIRVHRIRTRFLAVVKPCMDSATGATRARVSEEGEDRR